MALKLFTVYESQFHKNEYIFFTVLNRKLPYIWRSSEVPLKQWLERHRNGLVFGCPDPWYKVHGFSECGSHLSQSSMASGMFPDVPTAASKMEPLVLPSKWDPNFTVLAQLSVPPFSQVCARKHHQGDNQDLLCKSPWFC